MTRQNMRHMELGMWCPCEAFDQRLILRPRLQNLLQLLEGYKAARFG